MEMLALLALLLIAGRRESPTPNQVTGRVSARDQFLSTGVGVSRSLQADKIRAAPVIVGGGQNLGSTSGLTSGPTAQGAGNNDPWATIKDVVDTGLEIYNTYKSPQVTTKNSSNPESYSSSSKYSGASNDGGYNTKRK